MRKVWLVAKTTYRRRIRSGMFLVLTFSLPALMVVAGVAGGHSHQIDGGVIAPIDSFDRQLHVLCP